MSMLLFNNGIYLFVPLAILYIILYYLQQPFMPAVFSLVAIQHFVNITAGVWLANYLEKDINYRSLSSATAIIASAIGLIFLLAPVFYFQNKLPAQTRFSLKAYVDKLSSKKVMYAYIVAYFAASSLGLSAFLFSGFTKLNII